MPPLHFSSATVEVDPTAQIAAFKQSLSFGLINRFEEHAFSQSLLDLRFHVLDIHLRLFVEERHAKRQAHGKAADGAPKHGCYVEREIPSERSHGLQKGDRQRCQNEGGRWKQRPSEARLKNGLLGGSARRPQLLPVEARDLDPALELVVPHAERVGCVRG
eukprot:scaffold1878_cov258-Pinguiococcus_pyrenoidosus.AAC.23